MISLICASTSKIMETLALSRLLLLLTIFIFLSTIRFAESISDPNQDDDVHGCFSMRFRQCSHVTCCPSLCTLRINSHVLHCCNNFGEAKRLLPSLSIITDIVCTLPGVNCMKGKCRYSNDSSHSIEVPILGRVGFDCDCDPGWKKLQIGTFTYPSCLIPNCTLDFGCNSAPSQPALFSPPSLGTGIGCTLAWCGDGTCVDDSTKTSGYTCKCNDGSLNLMDNPELACFKTCSFGGDCDQLGFPSNSPTVTYTPTGLGVLDCSKNKLHVVTSLLLISIFLTRI